MPSLYVLPFDHRGSFKKLILEHGGDITEAEKEKLIHYKKVVFEGFKKVAEKRGVEDLAILVDEEYGKDIHKEAKILGARNLLSTEKSGQDVFDFEYENWQDHLLEIRPSYAKALIRVVIGEDNSLQNTRLKELSDFCKENEIKFLIEPLIQPSKEDLVKCGDDKKRFDIELRPERFAEAVREMHSAGIYPDVWKIEGTETKEAMDTCSEAAFEGEAENVEIVILGRGESMEKVEHWLTVGAKSKGVTGFAVGRTIFAEALLKLRNGEINEEDASQEIARRYEYFIGVFEKAKS
ncbi:DUF2090 domain-containing protein [Candidatus Peregrinibacteria bacterium]|nr:DUF2090 domain-containing protein [Candidatus Peregrinibacteria bacterium]